MENVHWIDTEDKTLGGEELCAGSNISTVLSNTAIKWLWREHGISLSSFWNLFVFKVFSFKGSLTWYPNLWKSPSSWEMLCVHGEELKNCDKPVYTWQLNTRFKPSLVCFPHEDKNLMPTFNLHLFLWLLVFFSSGASELSVCFLKWPEDFGMICG